MAGASHRGERSISTSSIRPRRPARPGNRKATEADLAPPGTAPGRRRDDGGPSSSSTSPTKNRHISYEEQGKRLQDRLDRPDKRWKLSRSDVSERGHWADYAAAHRDAIAETSTKSAPWYVIASDHKWFRNWEVSKILVDVLDAMDPRYPEPPPLEGVTFT
ncbi:MAG TPA: hypothetical protein VIJ09_08195 [Acidimicrobiales bacterium]